MGSLCLRMIGPEWSLHGKFMTMVETVYIDNTVGLWKLICAWKVFVNGAEESRPSLIWSHLDFTQWNGFFNENRRMELKAMNYAVYKLKNKSGVQTMHRFIFPSWRKSKTSHSSRNSPLQSVLKHTQWDKMRRQVLVLYESCFFFSRTYTSLTP